MPVKAGGGQFCQLVRGAGNGGALEIKSRSDLRAGGGSLTTVRSWDRGWERHGPGLEPAASGGAPRPAGSSPRAARGGRLPGERAAGVARAGAAAGSSAAAG